jgi:cytochrome c oxidase subunit 2
MIGQVQELLATLLANPLLLFIIILTTILVLTPALGAGMAVAVRLLDSQIRRALQPASTRPGPATSAELPAEFSRTRAGHRAGGPGAPLFVLVVLTVGGLVGTFARIMPAAGSRQAPEIDLLFNTMLGIAAAIFLLVEGVLVYAAFRFRRRKGELGDGVPIHGSNRLEIAWTLVPALIVAWLGAYSFQSYSRIYAPPPDAVVIEVISRQFQWEFRYPDAGITANDLYLPQGQPIRLMITSEDVIHSFWVPAFRVKQDAIPGRPTETSFTPDQIGSYRVVCAELCGAGHARMGLISHVIIQSQADFDAWVAQQQDAVGGPIDPLALFAKFGCNACHTLTAAGATGQVGPNLDEVGARAGSRVPGLAPEDYIRQSILDPNAHVVEGFTPNVMPQDFAQRMRPEELEALVAFLAQQR